MRAPHHSCAALSAATVMCIVPAAAVAAPPPCQGVPQISDVALDGHHPNTDVLAAWFSEQAGLQAVIRLRLASFGPVHDDSDTAGYALLYEVDGVRRYVRAEAPREGSMRYDHGTWTAAGGFVSGGPTTGVVEPTASQTVTINVPALPAGTTIRRPFALTYDGFDAPGQVHWVDRAPGGVTPAGDEFGADLVVGACGLGPNGPGGLAGTGPPGATGATGVPVNPTPGTVGTTTTAVALKARTRLTGGGVLRVAGSVAPARGGVVVSLRAQAQRTTTRMLVTRADGSFSASLPIRETTKLRTTADDLSSQTVTVTVRSRVRVKVRRTRSGGSVVTGQVWPALPGRILWLRDGAVAPTARTTPRAGRFRLRFARPHAGRYQAVFVPSGNRAERSTSNTGVIR